MEISKVGFPVAINEDQIATAATSVRRRLQLGLEANLERCILRYCEVARHYWEEMQRESCQTESYSAIEQAKIKIADALLREIGIQDDTNLSPPDEPSIPSSPVQPPKISVPGYVYLLRAGAFYKIGKSANVEKRFSQIKLQLPFPSQLIAYCPADDMNEAERSWHRFFEKQRRNGEWFELNDEHVEHIVAAFEIWKRRIGEAK